VFACKYHHYLDMFKFLYLLYLPSLLISDSAFASTEFSQDATNDGNNKFSFIHSFRKTNGSSNITIINAVGDIECSKILHDQLKNDDPTLFIALGDLCYKRDLTNFTKTYSDFKKANKLACVIGNHDSIENGNLKILNQAIQYCGDHWYLKTANNTTLLIGLNTNGNTSMQTNWAQLLVTNSTFMKGIKNVMLLAHKPAHTPPGSEDTAVFPTVQMFSKIDSNISKDIEVYEITAHNHLMAESSNGKWFISGAGSPKLYNFTSDPAWSFINNKEQGYLQIKINNTDGKVLSTDFYGLDGRLIY
jgi:predicted phosphodiesterase